MDGEGEGRDGGRNGGDDTTGEEGEERNVQVKEDEEAWERGERRWGSNRVKESKRKG